MPYFLFRRHFECLAASIVANIALCFCEVMHIKWRLECLRKNRIYARKHLTVKNSVLKTTVNVTFMSIKSRGSVDDDQLT
jgi:hypothetical protein